MYARIFVGVDASAHAQRALSHAVALAKGTGAVLRVGHVVEMGWLPLAPELGVNIEKVAASRLAEGEKLLAAAVQLARTHGVEAQPRLVETAAPAQRTAVALVEDAESWPADLIVVGARGLGAMERLLLGSVAEGVARRSTIPVLLVH